MPRHKNDAIITYRTCLGPCGKQFVSSGPGHRICHHCTPAMSKAPSFGRRAGTDQDRHQAYKRIGAT